MDQENNKNRNDHTLLNTDVSSVFVVQNSRNRPFIEQFEHTSINFTQKDLGTILGFFIVRDNSPSSENIVNFLSSEVKKRYFAPTEKPVEDKFESTLHHVNRVLEEIANIGNIGWLGTIEGIVCVIDDTSIHFSVTGGAHILLLRNNTLINISEGLASEDASNYPLKTFVDISSGDICPDDKIIITSRELLELVSLEELQKNAVRMGEKNFVQFIETVLTNECAIASATIIDVMQAEVPRSIAQPSEIKEPPSNFFGANSFTSDDTDMLPTATITDLINEDEDAEEPPKEYTDPRTGHIHIQGDDEILEKPNFYENFSEKCGDIFDGTKNFIVKKIRLLSKKITPKNKDHITQQAHDTQDRSDATYTVQSLYEQVIDRTKKYANFLFIGTKIAIHKFFFFAKNLTLKIRSFKQKTHPQKEISFPTKKKTHILPQMSKITNLWQTMSKNAKLSALGIIVIIVVVPLFLSVFTNKDSSENKEQTPSIEQQVAQEDAPNEIASTSLTTNSIPNPETLYQSPDTLRVVYVGDVPIGIEKSTIHTFDDTQKSFPLPDDSGNISQIAVMNDLNLIFIVTDTDKLYSFSPIAKKYQQQNNIPTFDHTKIIGVSTYLTYLYVLDDTMITRHTRIENGFDEGKEWLKEEIDFSDTTSIAINEEIFTTQDNNIAKFAEGKKQRYTKDASIENASLVYTNDDLNYIWILDTQNATLYKTDRETGKIIDTFSHSDLANNTSLAVDEKNDVVFTTTPDKTLRFSLKK